MYFHFMCREGWHHPPSQKKKNVSLGQITNACTQFITNKVVCISKFGILFAWLKLQKRSTEAGADEAVADEAVADKAVADQAVADEAVTVEGESSDMED